MEKKLPKIAIVYLLYYHNESYIDDAVSALKKVTYPKDRLAFVVVNNPHPEKGLFSRYVHDAVMPYSGKELPECVYLPQDENLGFAGGNNIGGDWALEHGYDYVFYHNNDGFFARHAFEPLVEALQSDETIGVAQSLMLLHPETELVNSAGNAFHYLGFGYTDENRTPIKELDLPKIKEVGYASGAALLVRADLIKKHGGWDPDFFMYHEDMEWCFRLRSLGYKSVLVRDSVFYHKYQFGRSIDKFFWMERNRFAVWLMYFKWRTLLVLLPMMLVLECGLILFAIKGGWFKKRLNVYAYWAQPKNVRIWLRKRKNIQQIRTVSDRQMLKKSVGVIDFQDEAVNSPILTYIGNPLMKAYHILVKAIVWW
ncbi:MAG: glycosyltransferase family 2 protein [Candidatus Magasanikbacteria bacterium]|jgi:GT2 family glycosyltransferase|nr:glycosyltransferase family 2 protein [Candidatus Magasanikbacteria bacterium]